jgi:serine/threonine protein kinase
MEEDRVFADRYKILSLLGVGGMGQVYRAEHLALRREVALKVLGSRTLGDGQVRFEREARAIARLDHPCCVRILDYGVFQHRRFIAMELLDGKTLSQTLLDEGPFSETRAIAVARSLLSALAHAHAHGVLHRDVKPENVMLARGRTVLIDFGLAALRDEAALTGSGLVLGSPSYIAPERLQGHAYDARADLYSVGVILYELLTGVRPFGGGSPEQIMHHALYRPPRPMRAARHITPALEALVLRALSKDPTRRFADAEDMLFALSDIRASDAAASVPSLIATTDPGTTLIRLASRPTLLRRLWSWLRYGRWRWRTSA